MTGLVPIARYFNPSLTITLGVVPSVFAKGEGFTMSFHVERSMAMTPDSAVIQIAGMEDLVQTAIGETWSRTGLMPMIVTAGYGIATARLFRGATRVLATNVAKGPDRLVQATADDGGDVLAEVPLRVSNAGMTSAQMVELAAAALKLVVHPTAKAVLAAALPSQQSAFTAVMIGQAVDLLDAACRRMRCRWWTRDSQLFLLKRRGLVDASRPAIVVQPQTQTSPLSPKGGGLFTIGTLFDPNIVPGSQLFAEGRFLRVEEVVHSGTTRGGEVWTSTITGRTLDA